MRRLKSASKHTIAALLVIFPGIFQLGCSLPKITNVNNSQPPAVNAVSRPANSSAPVKGRTISAKQTIKIDVSPDTIITRAAISPDMNTAAVVTTDESSKIGRIALHDLKTGKQRVLLIHNGSPLRSVKFSADGKFVAAGYGELDPDWGEIVIWETQTGKLKKTIKGNNNPASFIALSPDGKILASKDLDNVKIWDIETGALKKALGEGTPLAFSPDGKFLAVDNYSNRSHDIKIFDISSGETQQRLKGHKDSIICAAFSPDGSQLATGSSDKSIRVWALDNAAIISEQKGDSTAANIAFSPDGKLAAGDATQIAVWSAQANAGKLLLPRDKEVFVAIGFSPDGKTLATLGTIGNNIKLWDVSSL